MREKIEPTSSQKAAIETKGSSVLISAGAGSGKTRVITERLMSRISDPADPVDIDSFLIITFSRAAAAELRGRIMSELSDAQAEDPENRRLRRQSALCQRAQISTIHGFCAALLREFSHEVPGLSPDFKIIDEERADVMKAAALEKTMDACYEQAEKFPGFLFLADTVGAGRDDRKLSELIMNLHDRMQCHARPEAWAAEQVALLSRKAEDVSQTPWGREILDWAKELCDYWAAEMDRVVAQIADCPKIRDVYTPCLADTALLVRELRRGMEKGWDCASGMLPLSFPKLNPLRKSPDEKLSEFAKSRREGLKKAMVSVTEMMAAPSEKLLAEMEQTAPAMQALLEVTLEFDRRYARDKRRAGVVDYADLEHMAAKILTDEDGTPTELARQISRRYTEIMVDEYQDVSRVQDAIFHAVSREGKNLFLVGDMKQAIYRFRLADPEIFTEKSRQYLPDTEAGPGVSRRIPLRENFRSRREVIEGVNSVFTNCMSCALGSTDYAGDEKLIFGAAYYEGTVPKPELVLMELPTAAEDEETPDRTEYEADLVARQIKALVESGVTVSDKGRQRPAEYSDVAILLRSANAWGGAYRRALARQGISSVSGQGEGFFSSVEISSMMSMLAILDNPHQDIPLIAVLRSPSFGFSADELSMIRSADKNSDFYTALCTSAEKNEKCRAFLEKLRVLRAAAADSSATELVWRLIDELDMLAICSAMSDGEQRRANVLELITLAEHYEASGYRGLHRFVLWLRKQAEKKRDPNVGVSGSGSVKIMSIHKSKGLEFPIVFLCDTARRFNKSDASEKVLVHPQLGLGPKLTDLERRVEYPTLARNAIKQRLNRETLSEEMRLLYVALTRARERLFITGCVKNVDELLEKYAPAVTRPMSPVVLSAAPNPLSWLVCACLADGGEKLTVRKIKGDPEKAEQTESLPETAADPEILARLERNLRFVYPHEAAQALPSKITATELKGRAEKDEDSEELAPRRPRHFRMPDFAGNRKPLSGTERGIATHLVLQYMDFAAAGSRDGIHAEIERLRRDRFLSDREADAVDAEAIEKLFASPLGRRILDAEKKVREFKFSLLCDAEELFGSAAGERVLMQGVVDCCIEEDGALVIIDYKTDAVHTDAQIKERCALYTGQLRAYARAMERIFGKPVKECVLYFLSAGKAEKVC